MARHPRSSQDTLSRKSQAAALSLLERRCGGNALNRIRSKLERWKLPGLPRGTAEGVLDYLKFAFRLAPPRVSMSYVGLVWNRWCTSRRFQQNDKCVLCGKVGTRDSVEHYASCVTVLLLASYMVGTIPSNLDTHASRIAYFFGLPFKRKEDRLRHLLWIHAVYTLKNVSRSLGAPPQKKELFDFVDRFLCRLSRSKGPISQTSRECISKRKAEWAQFSLQDSQKGPSRRRTGGRVDNASHARPSDIPHRGVARPLSSVALNGSQSVLPQDRAVRPRLC